MHSLMYHDVYPDWAPHHVSGFREGTAAVYKLPLTSFQAHIDQLARSLPSPPLVLTRVHGPATPPPRDSWAITFDDGGCSGYDLVAPALERLGWRGYFFVTTSRIGTEGFLNDNQIRDLHERGHIVGAHSHTHPPRISDLSHEDIAEEWRRSVKCLADITGSPVTTASVPGGFYSNRVAKAAAGAGIRFLFTSEPSSKSVNLDETGCLVLGRYSIKRHTTARTATLLAAGNLLPRFHIQVGWQIRRIAKKSIGSNYEAIRKKILLRRKLET